MSRTRLQRRSPVGLRNIAEELGVSVSLVSKVLSGRLGSTGASPSKIDAIHRKARELNYRKNALAVALRSGRQNVLGVCIHRHGAPGSGIVDELVFGIAGRAARYQQRLAIFYYQTIAEFRDHAQGLHTNAIDGLIMGGLAHAELVDDLREMRDAGVPVVTIYDSPAETSLPNVGIDQFEIGRRASLHLIEQGCREVAHFHVCSEFPLPTARNAGFAAAMQERGVGYRDDLALRVTDFAFASGQDAMRALLRSEAHFDGIVAQSDQQAAAALNLLTAAGRRVPQQVKIIGVDNAPFCAYASIPLSSVSQEFVLRGQTAVDLLVQTLEGQPVTSVQIEPLIHVRTSTSSLEENP